MARIAIGAAIVHYQERHRQRRLDEASLQMQDVNHDYPNNPSFVGSGAGFIGG